MKPILIKLLIITLILTFNLEFARGQDTIFYPNGNPKEICESKNGKRECRFFEADGSALHLPDSINYFSLNLQGRAFDIQSITKPTPITENQLWRIRKLLRREKYHIEESQSFSIQLNDSLPSYFISTMNFRGPEYLFFLNDSTFIRYQHAKSIMTLPATIAISFQDYDKNGKTDIAYIVQYITGIGPREARYKERYDAVILLINEDGYEEYYGNASTLLQLKEEFESE